MATAVSKNSKTKKRSSKNSKGDFITIPRQEYEMLVHRAFPIDDEPFTASDKRAFEQARKDLKAGRLLTLDEFARKMGRKR